MAGFPDDPSLAPLQPYAGSPNDLAGGPAAPSASASAAPQPAARPRPTIAPAHPASWRVEIALKHPLIVDGVPLDRIAIRRLTARDIADLIIEDDDETSLNLRARAAMCGVHPDVLEALDAGDAQEVAQACVPFLPPVIVDIEARIAAAVDPSPSGA